MTTAKKAAAKKPSAPKKPKVEPKHESVAPDMEVVKEIREKEEHTGDWVRVVESSGREPDVRAISLALKEMSENDKLRPPRLVQIFKEPGRLEPRWIAVLAHG